MKITPYSHKRSKGGGIKTKGPNAHHPGGIRKMKSGHPARPSVFDGEMCFADTLPPDEIPPRYGLGASLRYCRQQAGVSGRALERAMHIDHRTIAAWEADLKPIPNTRLHQYAEALCTTVTAICSVHGGVETRGVRIW